MDDLAAAGTDAGADRPFGLEHQDVMTGLRERTGNGEPHDACADHDTLGALTHDVTADCIGCADAQLTPRSAQARGGYR
jgi:hypothetical protein